MMLGWVHLEDAFQSLKQIYKIHCIHNIIIQFIDIINDIKNFCVIP